MTAKKGIIVSREQLLYWYEEERKSVRDISVLLGIEYRSAWYWMKKLDIPRRCKSQALTKTWRADFFAAISLKKLI